MCDSGLALRLLLLRTLEADNCEDDNARGTCMKGIQASFHLSGHEQTQAERRTHGQAGRQREGQTGRQREGRTVTHRQRERHTGRHRQREGHMDRQREGRTVRHRQRERHTGRQREGHTDGHKQREEHTTDTDRVKCRRTESPLFVRSSA